MHRRIGLFLALGIVLVCYGVQSYQLQRSKAALRALAQAHPAPAIHKTPAVLVAHRNTANGLELSAEVRGIVKEIHVAPGQVVKSGDVLIRLDSSVEEAQLKVLQGKLKSAKAKDAVGLEQVQQIQLAMDEIKLRIKQKTIKAPFHGTAIVCKVQLGQQVAPGTPLLTLRSLNPLYVHSDTSGQYASEQHLQQPQEDMDS